MSGFRFCVVSAALAAGTLLAAPTSRWVTSSDGIVLPAYGEDDWRAGWIWFGRSGDCERWFRKAFSCDPADLRLAAFQWAADDGAEVFVNGKRLGQVTSWAVPKVNDRVLPLLTKGSNEILVRAWNRQSSSGFLGELDLVAKDGTVVKIGSGEDWEGAESKDGPWGRAREFMRKPQPPYGETPYVDYSGRNRGPAEPDLKPYEPKKGETLVTTIRRAHGAMHYMENGVEKPFITYRTTSTDGRLRALRYMESMDRAGVRLAEVCVSLSSVWNFLHEVDYEPIDRKILAALNYAPNMNLIVFINLDPPPWYLKHNAGDRCVLDSGVIGKMSYASATTLKDTRIVLEKVIQHLKHGPYYGRIAGFGLDGGDDGQFMQWSGYGYRQMGDYSPVMRQAFGRDIPSPERRRGGPDDLFLDETEDADVIAYNRLFGSASADFMLACAKSIKDVTERKKIVGAYYGKFYSIAGYLECGELAIRKVLDSPDVDYLVAVEYNQRTSGRPHSVSAPTESYTLHNKMFMDEADIRTFLDGQKNWGYAGDEKGTESMIRKMFALSFTRGHAIHWYDLFGGWFDHPAIERMIGDVQRIAARHMSDRVTPAEIAVVCDEESLIHAKSAIKRETGRTMNHLQNGILGRIGAPFDLYFADDLAAAPKYRMYVFLNCFAPTPAARRAIAKIEASGAVCVSVNPKDPVPTPAEYRALARKAGVHLISTADDVMVYAGRGLLGVHAGSAGRKPLRWPEKATFRDAVTGEIVAEGTSSFELEMEKGETRLLEVVPTGGGARFISPTEKRDGHTVASFYREWKNAKDVRKATLAATALGVFTVELNGTSVGNDFLKPGFTENGVCRHVYSNDVTGLLNRSAGAENCLIAQVAPTWWCDQINQANGITPWQLGKEVAFRCELKFEYADGTTGTLNTDTDWLAAYSARTQTAGLYEGEVYDERESVNYLKPAKVNDEFRGELRPATARIALREDLTLVPKDIYVTCGAEGATDDAYGRAKIVRRYREGDRLALNPGEMLVLDFGQNCAAVPMFQFDGRPGTTIEVRHAEMLNESNGERRRGNDGPAGTPYLASLRSAYAGIRYTMAGGGNVYRPSFTFFGYRYIGVTTTAPVTFVYFHSIPVSSITKEMECGTITTGDARVNRLIENIRWGMRSNFLSIPTDCPQRDERLGWTADAQVFMNSAAYLADTYGFFSKYLADLRDAQDPNGLYPCVAPNARHVMTPRASAGWSDAGVLMPYRLWKWYGRTDVIEACWESMESYMRFLRGHDDAYGYEHGDWLAYEHDREPEYRAMISGLFAYWTADLMRQMAEAIGLVERAAFYRQEAARLKRSFQERYLDEDGVLKWYYRGQCSDLYMLKLGLCGNAAAVEATKKDLIDNIRAHGNRLQTGFLGTAILMPTLTFEANAPDVAYDLLFQDQDPSWLYSVDQGATTVWERWNSYTKEKGFGPTSMNSFNHYAYGCVLEWLFSAAAGIRPDPKQAGWKHFILQPFADRRLGHLDSVYDSPAGRIASSWKYDADGKLHWSFSIPEGATATVTVPGGETREYGAGDYEL